MNVSLMLLILVAYIQDWGLLYTLRNQCLDQLRHLAFPGQVFVLISVGITIPSPLEMCLASKGSVSISVQKQTPIKTIMVVSKY